MQGRMKWFAGTALAGGLLIGSLVAMGVNAQTATPGAPAASFCPGSVMLAGRPGQEAPAMGIVGPVAEYDAIAAALGITSQELWDARAAGNSVADLATEKKVDLSTALDSALATHSAQLDAAVKAGMLTQAQADAMQALMTNRLQSHFQATTGFRPGDPGMMGGHGMMGPGFGPRGRGTP